MMFVHINGMKREKPLITPERQNLLDAAQANDTNLKSLSLKLGKSHSYLHQYVNYHNPNKLDGDMRIQLAEWLNISPEDLAPHAKLERLNFKEINEKPKVKGMFKINLPNDTIPAYGGASATDGNGYRLNSQFEVSQVPRHHNQLGFHSAFAIYVHGDSMEPRYEEGDLVYLVGGQAVKPNTDVVFDLADVGVCIKRFLRKDAKRAYFLQYNPRQEISYPLADIVNMYPVVGRG